MSVETEQHTGQPALQDRTGEYGTMAEKNSYQYEELPCWGSLVLQFARFTGDDLYSGSPSPETHW